MSFSAAVVIATMILAATAIGMIAMIASRKRQEREDELKQAASVRGWKFDSRTERGSRIHHWTGSTDAVSWVAESISSTGGGKGRQQRRQHVVRWHGDSSPGVVGPIAVLGVPKDQQLPKPDFHVSADDGLIAKLAHKAVAFAFDKGIDSYFGETIGKEVDAGALHRIEVTTLPGYIVMAADKEEGARILSEGLERALIAGADDKSSVLSDEERPSILLRPKGISIARPDQLSDTHQLERFIRAGVSLTRSPRFRGV